AKPTSRRACSGVSGCILSIWFCNDCSRMARDIGPSFQYIVPAGASSVAKIFQNLRRTALCGPTTGREAGQVHEQGSRLHPPDTGAARRRTPDVRTPDGTERCFAEA